MPEGQCILFGGNEGCSHEIDIVLDAHQDIRLVLLGKIRTGHDLIGEAHALAVAEGTANHGTAMDIRPLKGLYPEHHKAVIDQDLISHRKILR